jgi:hypothetical protein
MNPIQIVLLVIGVVLLILGYVLNNWKLAVGGVCLIALSGSVSALVSIR